MVVPVCRSGFISRSAVVSKIMFYSLALLESCAKTVCVGQWHHKLLTWHAPTSENNVFQWVVAIKDVCVLHVLGA